MATVNPYLNFDGTCGPAFTFYKAVFGGEFISFVRYKDVPEGMPVKEDEAELILHVNLPLANGTALMGSDRPLSTGKGTNGNNFTISINTESEAEATKIYNGLSEGGKITMPLQKTFWAALFGMFTDKYGVQWMVNYDHPREH
jgi:PhnB protein